LDTTLRNRSRFAKVARLLFGGFDYLAVIGSFDYLVDNC